MAVAPAWRGRGLAIGQVGVTSPPVTAFTLGDVARICKVPEARLRYWERTALLETGRRGDARPAFGFRDLVSVRTLVDLLEQGVPLRRIRRSVETVRERMPELERPLGALRFLEHGVHRLVVRRAEGLCEPDGQMVLDFAGDSGAGVALLVREEPPRARSEQALEWFELGCGLDTRRETFDEAIEAYQRAIEADPDLADAHCNLGSVYFHQERRSAARACYERALALESRHLEANLNLAALLEDEGHGELALRHYKIALEVDPLHADTHVSLALLYERLGLPRRGREHWRRYLQLDPDGAWAEIARRHLVPG